MKPNEEMDILELLDNGVNADTTQGDGVYSKYYIHATQAGRYTVKCQVTSNDKALERLGFIGSANPPPLFGSSFIFTNNLYHAQVYTENPRYTFFPGINFDNLSGKGRRNLF